MSIKGSLRKIKNFWKGCKTDSRISIFKIGKMIAKNRFKISRVSKKMKVREKNHKRIMSPFLS